MFNKKKILAIIPARGGSKGLRLKNLRKVNKVPLVAYVAKIVNKIPLIDRAVVSTDHKKIAKIAKKAGLSVPFKRPFKISGDKISDYDVIVHALNFMEKKDKTKYDIIVSLPPTSPLRKPADVIGAGSFVFVDVVVLALLLAFAKATSSSLILFSALKRVSPR